jgi:hypothetical protein
MEKQLIIQGEAERQKKKQMETGEGKNKEERLER